MPPEVSLETNALILEESQEGSGPKAADEHRNLAASLLIGARLDRSAPCAYVHASKGVTGMKSWFSAPFWRLFSTSASSAGPESIVLKTSPALFVTAFRRIMRCRHSTH